MEGAVFPAGVDVPQEAFIAALSTGNPRDNDTPQDKAKAKM